MNPRGLLGMVVMGQWLNLMILAVFSNLSNSDSMKTSKSTAGGMCSMNQWLQNSEQVLWSGTGLELFIMGSEEGFTW